MKVELHIDGTEGGTHSLESPCTVVLGRSPKADLVLADRKVSRRHCELELLEDRCLLRDLKSGNGTLVNGRRVSETALFNGDRIKIGNSSLTLACEQLKRASLLDETHACTACGRQLSLATFADGEVEEAGDVFLCPTCSASRIPGSPMLPGFRLLRAIGQGTSGLVYKAHQHSHDRVVALKILRVSNQSNVRDVMRFIRGARSEAVLIHPHIIQVYDFGVEGELYYMAMEYFEGRNLLNEMRERGSLSVLETVHIGRQIADALAYAFERNIVHRDLKPENILIHEGTIKISDFGLAKNFSETGISGLTRPGEGMGTLAYMPPEQIDNAVHADQRSDIYSLGATLYHVVTGRLPFAGRRPSDVIHRIRSQDPLPVTLHNPLVPEPLVRMIQKAMQKDPAKRFQKPAEVMAILEEIHTSLLAEQSSETRLD